METLGCRKPCDLIWSFREALNLEVVMEILGIIDLYG